MYRVFVMTVLAALLTANAAFARDFCFASACDPCEPAWGDPCEPLGSDLCKPTGNRKGSLFDQFTIYGWLQAGITVNAHGQRNTYTDAPSTPLDRNLDALSGNSFILMSKHPSDFSVYQLWLGAVKKADTSRGFDWGFNVDMLFGTDAKYGQSFGDQTFDYGWGSGDYNTSIIQLFGTVGYRDLQFRIGKFATGMTHEALPCVATFFHSYAFNCYNVPLHVFGVMADYSVSKRLTVSGGWNAGEQNSFENRFDDGAFLGNVTFTPGDRLKVAYNLYLGRSYGLGRGIADADTRFGRTYHTASQTVQSLVLSVNISPQWLYMIETAWSDNRYDSGTTKTFYTGINQHLIYTINKEWAAGLRAEWSHGKGTLFDIPDGQGNYRGYDLYALTLGANWTPNKWLIVRPELRHDWSDYNSGFRPFANGTKANQLSGRGSFIVKF